MYDTIETNNDVKRKWKQNNKVKKKIIIVK